MHALIEYLNADGDLLFSMITRHPSDAALVTLGLSYTSARRARFAREQFQEFSDWKASVKQDHPALWQSLRQAQDRFTDLSVLPTFTGGPSMDLIRQQADAIGDIERDIFDSGAFRRAFSMGSTSDILVDMGVDQLVANVNFGKVLIIYVVYNEVRIRQRTARLSADRAATSQSSAMRNRRSRRSISARPRPSTILQMRSWCPSRKLQRTTPLSISGRQGSSFGKSSRRSSPISNTATSTTVPPC